MIVSGLAFRVNRLDAREHLAQLKQVGLARKASMSDTLVWIAYTLSPDGKTATVVANSPRRAELATMLGVYITGLVQASQYPVGRVFRVLT